MFTNGRAKRLSSLLTRSTFFAVALAAAHGVAVGQDTLALSSGSAAPGTSVALNLSLSSQAGSAPTGLQWTLAYATNSIASVTAVAGASAIAAGKTISCFSSPGAATCLLAGINDNTMQNGVAAVITVTMTPAAVSSVIGVSNLIAATPAGGPMSITGTDGAVTVPLPMLSGLSCSPATLGTGGSTNCTVTLSQTASAGGASVALSCSTGELSLPSSVTVAAGATSANFSATAGTIPNNLTAGITGALNGSTQTAYISLVAPTTVSQLSCVPATLGAGGTSACTVTLSRAAGPAGVTVGLSSNAAALTVPPSVSVGWGTTSANFTATAGTFNTMQTAVVTASYNSSSQTAPILLATSTTVSLVSCSPASLGSGGVSACTVTLSQPAGSGGVAVALSSNATVLSVPPSVNVLSGAVVANFAATAGTIDNIRNWTITDSNIKTSDGSKLSFADSAAKGRKDSVEAAPK